ASRFLACLFLAVQKFRHERRPDRDGVGRADKIMAFITERRHQMVFDLTAGGGKGLAHPIRQGGAEKRVVLDINPEHWHARRAAELADRLYQFVRCAVVVGLAVDTATAAGGKSDDRLDLGWVEA